MEQYLFKWGKELHKEIPNRWTFERKRGVECSEIDNSETVVWACG